MNKLLKNPYLNGLLAEIYIIIIVWIMHSIGGPDTPDNFFSPVAALSLFVLSAAVMGYLFLAKPLQMYLDGAKPQAVTFFLKTVVSFAVLTLIVIILMSTVFAQEIPGTIID